MGTRSRDKERGTAGRAAARGLSEYARTAGMLGGQYLKFFAGAIGATLLLQVTIITDTIIVGQLLGPVAMSGLRVASPVVNILNVLAMLVGVGGSTVVSIAIGRRERESANRAFTLTIAFGIAVGLVVALTVAPLAGPIAALISSEGSTVEYTAAFLRIVSAASPVYILSSVMAILLRADSCIKLSSAVLALAGVANVGFDLLFMGALGMGVEGSALATDMGMLVAVAASFLYFRWPRRTLHLCSLRDCVHAATIAAILKNGAPSAVRMLFACVSLLFLNFVVGGVVGVAGIALLTVCGNVQLLAVAVFSSGGQAAMPMEGVLYGERDYGGLKLLMRFVFRIVGGCVAAIIVVLWLFPGPIVSLFVPGGLEGSEGPLRIYSLGFAPLAANYVMTYYFNTIQRRKIAMALTICENLVFYLPLIWALTHAYGLMGAVLAFVVAEVAAFGLMLVMAAHEMRKTGLDNLLLLPNTPREVVLEASVPASGVDAANIAHAVKGALDKCGVDAARSLRAAMGVEEMVANAASHGARGRADVLFDVIVSSMPDRVQVALRDNGPAFDPTRYEREERGEFEIDNITALRAVATSVEYANVLGLNQTVVVIAE